MKRSILPSTTVAMILATGLYAAEVSDLGDLLHDREVVFAQYQYDAVKPILGLIMRQEQIRPQGLWSGFGFSHDIVDLNGDGVNEVFVKQTGSEYCDKLSCPIYIASYDEEGGWGVIGHGRGNRVVLVDEIEPGQFRDIMIDDFHFQYDLASQSYALDISAYGTLVQWEDAAIAFEGKGDFLDEILQRSLGQRSIFLGGVTSKDDKTLVGWADLNGDGSMEYLMQVRMSAVCDMGCPLFLYRDLEEVPFAELVAEKEKVVISDILEEGRLKAIYTAKTNGWAKSYSWDPERSEYLLN